MEKPDATDARNAEATPIAAIVQVRRTNSDCLRKLTADLKSNISAKMSAR